MYQPHTHGFLLHSTYRDSVSSVKFGIDISGVAIFWGGSLSGDTFTMATYGKN